ncbi:MAG: hypothetical protein ABIH83_03350 [Candidatus Micrarchaeota archaeon]
MKNIYAAAFAILLLSVCIFAKSDVELKKEALDFTVGGIMQLDSPPSYDNFISNDGKEYVIVIIDGTPSFLVNLIREGEEYVAKVVYENNTIRQVVEGRYSQTGGKSIGDVQNEIHEYILEFDNSRFFYEAKYNMLLGLRGRVCESMQECEEACLSSEVCEYAYEKEGVQVIENVYEYSKTKKEIDTLVSKEKELLEDKGNKNDLEVLETYSDIIERMGQAMESMKNSNMQKAENLLYLGEIKYNTETLSEAKNVIDESIVPARNADERKRSIASIQEITSLRAPPPGEEIEKTEPAKGEEEEGEAAEVEEGKQEAEDWVDMGDNATASGLADSEEEISAEEDDESIPPIDKPVREDEPLNFDNIILIVAAVIVLVTIVEAILAIRRYLEKRKGGLGGGKLGIPSLGGRKVQSLEDLV